MKYEFSATTPAKVWILDRQTFQKIMIYSDYQEHEEYVKFLSTVPGLQQLSSSVLFKLSELLEKVINSCYIIMVNTNFINIIKDCPDFLDQFVMRP